MEGSTKSEAPLQPSCDDIATNVCNQLVELDCAGMGTTNMVSLADALAKNTNIQKLYLHNITDALIERVCQVSFHPLSRS